MRYRVMSMWMAFVLAMSLAACHCGGPKKDPPKTDPPKDRDPIVKQCIPYVRGMVITTEKKPIRLGNVTWHPKATHFASVSLDGTVYVRKELSGIIELSFQAITNGQVWQVLYTPDGNALLTAGSDGLVRLWQEGKEIRSFLPPKAGLLPRSIDTRTLTVNGESVPVLVIGYQAPGGGGMLFWKSLSDKVGLAGRQETASAPRSVALSANGAFTAVGFVDGSFALFDTHSSQSISQAPKAHTDAITGLSWTQDGKHLATASHDGSAKIWRLAGSNQPPQPVQTLGGFSARLTSIAFSPDDKLLAVAASAKDRGEYGQMRIWDASALQGSYGPNPAQEIPQYSYHPKEGTVSISWKPVFDKLGHKMALGYYNGAVRHWVYDGLPRVMWARTPVEPITSFVQSRDEKTWVYGTTKGVIYAQPVVKYEGILKLENLGASVVRVSFDRDTPYVLAALADGQALAWDWQKGQVWKNPGHGSSATDLTVRRDGRGFLVTYEDGSAKLFNSNDLTKVVVHWKGLHKAPIRSAHWSYGGDLLATAADDGSIKIWSFEPNDNKVKLLQEFKAPAGHPPHQVAFSNDDSRLAVGMAKGKLGLWQRYAGKWKIFSSTHGTAVLRWKALDPSVLITARWDPKGSTAKDYVLHIWDTTNPNDIKHKYVLDDAKHKHKGPVTSIDIKWNDQTIQSSSLDGTFFHWKYRRAYPMLSVYLSTAAVSLVTRPDGNELIAGTSESSVHMWKFRKQQQPSLRIMKGHNQTVPHVAINNQGDRLFTAGHDGKLIQWDVSNFTPKQLQTYPAQGSSFQPMQAIVGISLNKAQDHAVVGAFSAADPHDTQSGQIAIWSLTDASKPIQVFSGLPRVYGIVWHPNKDMIVTGHYGADVRIWEKAGGSWKNTRTYPKRHAQHVSKLAVGGAKGELFATVGIFGAIRVWRLSDGVQVNRFDTGGPRVTRLLFHPAGHSLTAALTNGQIKIWNLESNKLTHTLSDPDLFKTSGLPLAHSSGVSNLSWSADGTILYSSGGTKIKQWKCAAK